MKDERHAGGRPDDPERAHRKAALEKVDWELPAELLGDLREHCRAHDKRECEAVRDALRHYLAERSLEEGE